MAYAHSRNRQGQRQDLADHLRLVADVAHQFGQPFGAGDLARMAGMLHDIGKFNPAWQQYLLDAEANPTRKQHGPDHKGAGACLALATWPTEPGATPLPFLIRGHHGGLPSKADLKSWLRERATDPAVGEAQRLATQQVAELTAAQAPEFSVSLETALRFELFLRMAFSALVDADFLDTERHFQAAASVQRPGAPPLDDLWRQIEAGQAKLTGQHTGTVNAVRHQVYQQCLAAAELTPGFFRLTVPTGGGKTRSSLAFALRHALLRDKQRVIYAIPYTSIIEQTADVFRAIFVDERAVLEHHSAARWAEDVLNPTPAEVWARLAAENWDAPLVVTTTVQLFESLLGNSPSACRKLHSIAGSVLILDELQMLPTHLLTAILDVLRELVAHYGVTVLLCTATQPALHDRPEFAGLPSIHDIVTDAEELFAQLARVTYEWPATRETWSWAQVSAVMHEAPQALTVVNARADALALLDALDDPHALHLSTRLCSAHRRAVLAEARRRLDAGEPCRLVATQVIEAGVDVDFPLVLRALGPLDRIAQAAGRCNREGRLAQGRVIVFAPEAGKLPKGPYHIGTGDTRTVIGHGAVSINMHDPALHTRYFETYYGHVNRDERLVQAARKDLDYPEVARRFTMIEDDAASVVVRYGTKEEREAVADALTRLRQRRGSPRDLLRKLQPYVVGLRTRKLEQAQLQGLIDEVIPGVWEWKGRYDDAENGTGIVLGGALEPEGDMW